LPTPARGNQKNVFRASLKRYNIFQISPDVETERLHTQWWNAQPAPAKCLMSWFGTYVLRHKPQSIGLSLDKNGWASVAEILQNSKIRFSFE